MWGKTAMMICCVNLVTARRNTLEMVDKLAVPEEGSQPIRFDSTYAKGFLTQTRMCLWKNNNVYWRCVFCVAQHFAAHSLAAASKWRPNACLTS